MKSHVTVGDDVLDDGILASVEVTEELNRHAQCVIRLRQTLDARPNVEELLGQPVQVTTYGESGAANIAFAGFMLEAELEYEISGSFAARLVAVSHSYRLDGVPRESYWRQKKLSDVASAIGGRGGVAIAVNCGSAPPARNYVQFGESDFNFLARMVDDYEAWTRHTPTGLEIRDSFEGGPTLTWDAEAGLLSFAIEGELGAGSFTGTHHSAYTMISKALSVTRQPEFTGASARMSSAVLDASEGMPPGQLTADDRAATDSEYQEVLEGEHARSLGRGVVANGISRVDKVRAGSTVEIQGALDAQGTYGVTKVIHRWTPTGYENEFWCTPWKNYRNPSRPTGAKIHGVVTARVVSHNDPKNMGRLQVRYDWQDGATAWARMAAPHAGSDRGFLFLPEIGDEVLVAFEQGDPERPYILGSLWNGMDTAPREEFWGGDVAPNNVKRIVTKSGHRIQLSDKQGREGIVIATPATLKLSMLEQADETHRPMMLLNAADGDIVFNAPNGRIHLHSQSFSREIGAGPVAEPAPASQPVRPARAPASTGNPAAKAQKQRAKARQAKQRADPMSPRWAKTKYGSGPWYPPNAQQNLDKSAKWSDLIRDGKVTAADKRIISAVAPNEGSLDAVQAYDDQVVSLGAMQKTVNPKGEGELPKQIEAFKQAHPAEYRALFASKGWTVRRDPVTLPSKKRGGQARQKLSEPRLYYADPANPAAVPVTGKALKSLLCDKDHPETYQKALAPLRQAGQDPEFQGQQIQDFRDRLHSAMGQSAKGYDSPIADYVKSERGAALVLDQSVNRPGHVEQDMGKSLDQFYKKHPDVSRDPGDWTPDDRKKYEREILSNYQKNRRMVDAQGRATRINSDGRLDPPVVNPNLD